MSRCQFSGALKNEKVEDLDWFIKLLIVNDQDSHGVLFWQAINVKSSSLRYQIEKTRERFAVENTVTL